MAGLPELALRPGYETPRDLPQGECILRGHYDVHGRLESVEITRADPRVLISAELLGHVAASPSPAGSLTMADGPNGTPFFAGALLKIEGVNRTVIYRIGEYIPAVHGYVAEWPD